MLVGIFIVGTPILIGYSQGYRLDDALLVIETGGIYVHSDIANATVYLEGDFVKESGAFFKNTFVQDLRPNRTYEIWVEKEGYQSWTKKLTVYPNLVTEARVMMLPDTFTWRSIPASTTVQISTVPGTSTSPVDADTATSSVTTVTNPEYENLQVFFTKDMDQFAVEIATSTYIEVKGKRVATTTTVIEMQFPEWFGAFASTTILAEQDMVRERDGIVAWLGDGDLYVTWGKAEEEQPYYFCTTTCTNMLKIDWQEPITRYEFYPNRSDVVVLGTERGVYAVELDNRSERNIQPFIEEENLTFRILADGSLVIFEGSEFRETSW